MSAYHTLDFVMRVIEGTADISEVQTNDDVSRLIEVVFEEEYILTVDSTVYKILELFPDYRLSPRQQLYVDISGKTIQNAEQLQKRMSELGVEQLDDTGYMICNRAAIENIYCPSDRVVNSYSLNFLWINVVPQSRDEDEAEHIFGNGKDSDLLNKHVDILSKWREQNAEAVINLWFDSALVTEKSYLNTVQLLNGIDVQLRDIRSLTNIPDFIEASLHPTAQLYYRVDILKVLITDHMYSESCRYTVMVDIDVQPMNSEQLFDKITLQLLDQYGYLYTNTSTLLFENGFSMFDTSSDRVRTVHRKYMLDRMNRILSTGKWFDHSTVYNSYYSMVAFGEIRGKYEDRPRKPVTVPLSQFADDSIDTVDETDYRKVKFRMNADKSIEFRYGPHCILNSLREWTAVPLKKKMMD